MPRLACSSEAGPAETRHAASLQDRKRSAKISQGAPPMKRTAFVLALAGSLAFSVGCTTKKYVRQQSTPIIEKTNELDDLTAKNTNAIKDVDSRSQSGIQQVNTAAAAADQKAQ